MAKHKCKWGVDYYGKEKHAELVKKLTPTASLDWHGDAMECGESIETARREHDVDDYLVANKPGYYAD